MTNLLPRIENALDNQEKNIIDAESSEEIDFVENDEDTDEFSYDSLYLPTMPVQREVEVTLDDGKSMTVLASQWKERVLPFLGGIFLCVTLCGFMLLVISLTLPSHSPYSSHYSSPDPIAGLKFFTKVLVRKTLIASELITYWFSGPQSLFLTASIFTLIAGAIKVFRLKLFGNHETTIKADERQIVICTNWLNIIFYEEAVRWFELAFVSLRTKTDQDQTCEFLIFRTKSGKQIEVDATCLKDARLRRDFISLIKRYAPHALSNELETKNFLLESTTYADIWMDTLHQKNMRLRCGDLSHGESLSNERFMVVRKLGAGGQGTAYLATVQYLCDKVLDGDTDPELEMVVLKEFILPGFENPALMSEIIARIQHEALLLKSLNHRQIVRVIDAFIEDFRGYLVIEHVEGTSLREYVSRRGPLSENHAVELASQMCGILDYLHGHAPQVVHRDFTPDNLIIDSKGMLKLIDFNLAKVPNFSDNALCVGKPPYMAPEQVRGCPEPASDFYSMGALLHFLLTGEDPEPLTACTPKAVNPMVSISLNHLIERLTCQETDLRINSASQVRKLLSLQGVSPIGAGMLGEKASA